MTRTTSSQLGVIAGAAAPEKPLNGGAFGTLYRIAISRWKEGPGDVNIPMPVFVYTLN